WTCSSSCPPSRCCPDAHPHPGQPRSGRPQDRADARSHWNMARRPPAAPGFPARGHAEVLTVHARVEERVAERLDAPEDGEIAEDDEIGHGPLMPRAGAPRLTGEGVGDVLDFMSAHTRMPMPSATRAPGQEALVRGTQASHT